MIITLWTTIKNCFFSDAVGVIELNSFQGDLQKTCRLYELKGNLMIIENCNHKTVVTLVYSILFLRNRFVYFHTLVKKLVKWMNYFCIL